MTINLLRSRRARMALLAVFLATLGAGLFICARAPYVIDLPSAPDRPIDAEPDRYRCMALDCRQPLPPEMDVLGNPAAWRYPDCHQAQARTVIGISPCNGRPGESGCRYSDQPRPCATHWPKPCEFRPRIST